MKVHMKLAAVGLCGLLLAGCAATNQTGTTTTITPVTVQSFTDTATKLCAVVQPTVSNMQLEATLFDPPLTTNQQAQLNQVQDNVNTFCGAVASVTTQDAQGLIDATFPVLMNTIADSSLKPSDRNAVLLSLVGVKTAADILLSQYKANSTAVQVTTTPTTTTDSTPAQPAVPTTPATK